MTMDRNLTIVKIFPFRPTRGAKYRGEWPSWRHIKTIKMVNIGVKQVNTISEKTISNKRLILTNDKTQRFDHKRSEHLRH